jgi:hypothetical protein
MDTDLLRYYAQNWTHASIALITEKMRRAQHVVDRFLV